MMEEVSIWWSRVLCFVRGSDKVMDRLKEGKGFNNTLNIC